MNKHITERVYAKPDGSIMAKSYEMELSTGASIYVIAPYTAIGPEEMAMIQALASRDPQPTVRHLDRVAKVGAETFMASYYKGYGHKSIGDLGHVLISMDGISMLAAKAVQDSPLYAGQEASTRYIDFRDQPFLSFTTGSDSDSSPIRSGFSRDQMCMLQESLRNLYVEMLPKVMDKLKLECPLESQPEGTSSSKWEMMIKARAFDIVRSLLPAGATTMAVWYTSISHASDYLSVIRNHVLTEVRLVADAIQSLLEVAYPSSFSEEGMDLERVTRRKQARDENDAYMRNYFHSRYYLEHLEHGPDVTMNINLDTARLSTWDEAIMSRPQGRELPTQIGECGTLDIEFALDYGSFRDIQRHRAVTMRQGLLTGDYGIDPWYVENMPDEYRDYVVGKLNEHVECVRSMGLDKWRAQYLIPMGFQIPVRLTGTLGKVLYIVEQRAHPTVHTTLHKRAVKIANKLQNFLSSFFGVKSVPMYINPNVGEMTLKRGGQTFFKDGQAV